MTARKLITGLLLTLSAALLGPVNAGAQSFFSIGGGNDVVGFNFTTVIPTPAPAPVVHFPLRPGYVYDDGPYYYHSGKKAYKEARKARKEMRKAGKHYRKAMRHARKARAASYYMPGIVEVYPGFYYDDDDYEDYYKHYRHHKHRRHHHHDDDDDDD